jgi:hypothetical protein
MSENRGYWYLLTGLLIGLALGILFAWVVAPLEYTDTTPASLRADFKDEYRYLIAASYRTNGNLERARARLALLGDPDPAAALGEQAQRLLAGDAPMSAVRVLADLAEVLQNPAAFSPQDALPDLATTDQVAAVSTPTLGSQPAVTLAPTNPTSPFEPILDPTETPTLPPTPTETSTLRPGMRTATLTRTPLRSATPIATVTPKPSLTPTATPGQPFQLVDQSTFCDPNRPALLQVVLEDAAGNPASGIEIAISWLGGEETFFTGLKPELGFGYADFSMNPGVEYALSLSNGITRISGLQTTPCSLDSGEIAGGIRLKFRQP